jgi:hypothetical protein
MYLLVIQGNVFVLKKRKEERRKKEKEKEKRIDNSNCGQLTELSLTMLYNRDSH